MTVVCRNEECSEFEVLKTNALGLEVQVDEIVCGKCGGPVEEVAEDG